jgi:hypothetical protein
MANLAVGFGLMYCRRHTCWASIHDTLCRQQNTGSGLVIAFHW